MPPTTEVDSNVERAPREGKDAAPKSGQTSPQAVKTAYAAKTSEGPSKVSSKEEQGTPPKSTMKKVPENPAIKTLKESEKDKKMMKVPDTKEKSELFPIIFIIRFFSNKRKRTAANSISIKGQSCQKGEEDFNTYKR